MAAQLVVDVDSPTIPPGGSTAIRARVDGLAQPFDVEVQVAAPALGLNATGTVHVSGQDNPPISAVLRDGDPGTLTEDAPGVFTYQAPALG